MYKLTFCYVYFVQTSLLTIYTTCTASLSHPLRSSTCCEMCTGHTNGKPTLSPTGMSSKIWIILIILLLILHRSRHCSTFKDLCKAEERKEDFTVYTFHTFMLNHKYLLIPAFQLQRTLREKICGRAFWRKQAERREKMHPAAAYVSIAQLLNPVRR